MTDRTRELRVAIGVELREFREASGMSKAALSRKASVSESFITSLENGTGNQSFFRVARVAEALGVSMSEIARRAQDRIEAGGD